MATLKHLGTRIATAIEAFKGRRKIRKAMAAQSPKPATPAGRGNFRRATRFGWDLDLIRSTFPGSAPRDWDDLPAFQRCQAALGVTPDGDFGPTSYKAMMSRFYAHGFLIVGGYPYPAPPGIAVVNWYDKSVGRYKSVDRRGRTVNAVVKHESTNGSAAATHGILVRRDCGVHLTVTELTDAVGRCLVRQHHDLAWERVVHAASLNGPSVGVEVINAYYHEWAKPPANERRIVGAWVDAGPDGEKDYVPPLPRQCEAVALLTEWLTSNDVEEPAFQIQRRWVGLDGDGNLAMSSVDHATREPGIQAHTYSHHADGAFPVLYALLRLEGHLGRDSAWDVAGALANTARREVPCIDNLPLGGDWKQRAGRA